MWRILILAIWTLTSSKLIMVQEVFRHGARYPIYPSPYDNTTYAIQEDRVGELTAEGKRMHYLLGQRIFKSYWTQLGLNDTVINSSQIFVKSTNVNRTIESAQSHLMGLFENLEALKLTPTEANMSLPAWDKVTVPPEEEVFVNIPTFHTFPIHTELQGSSQLNPGDFLLYFSRDNCPKSAEWEQQNFKSDFAKQVRSNIRISEAITNLQTKFNITNQTLDDIANFVDNFYCSKHLGRYYNPQIFDNYKDALDTIRAVAYNLGVFGQQLQINSTITPFFKATLESMRNIIKGKSDTRLIIYSAHDMTVANILNGLRLTSAKCIWEQFVKPSETVRNCITKYPEFASSVIFELSQNDTNPEKYYVKIRYSGEYLDIPFCNDAKICNFEDFEAYLTSTIRETYLQDCDVKEVIKPAPAVEESAPIGLIIPLCLVSALLFLIIVYEVYRYVKKRKEESNNGPYQTNMEEAA